MARHPDAGSVPGTPEASLQDSESEDIYEPDDVVAGDPKGSGRTKGNRRSTRSQTPKKAGNRSDSGSPAPKKKRVGKFSSKGVCTKQKAKYSTGGDMTKTPHYRAILAGMRSREESRKVKSREEKRKEKSTAKKTPRSGIEEGAARPVEREKSKYGPLSKYDNKTAKDFRRQAHDIRKLPEWRNSYDFNPKNYAPAQTNFNQALREIWKEMGIPDYQDQQKQIAQHKTDELQQVWRKHFAKQEQAAVEEACMHNVAGVAGIAWYLLIHTIHCVGKGVQGSCLVNMYLTCKD